MKKEKQFQIGDHVSYSEDRKSSLDGYARLVTRRDDLDMIWESQDDLRHEVWEGMLIDFNTQIEYSRVLLEKWQNPQDAESEFFIVPDEDNELSETMEEVKPYLLYVSFVDDERGLKSSGMVKYSGKSMQEALLEIINKLSYAWDDEDDDENPTEEMLLAHLKSHNGDGCAYIISIIRDNGEIIFAEE